MFDWSKRKAQLTWSSLEKTKTREDLDSRKSREHVLVIERLKSGAAEEEEAAEAATAETQ